MKLATLISALAVTLLLVACSGDDSDGDDAPPDGATATETDGPTVAPELLDQPEPAQEPSSEVTAAEDGTVEVVINGSLFENNNVAIPLSTPVEILVVNQDSVIHNLRIAGLDGEFETEDDAVTEPESIAGGESGHLTFAPPVAGAYTFRCDFHPGTMGGQIVVE